MNILLADDEQGIRDLFCFLLEPEGHTITTVSDGLTAVERVKDENFDIVFLDIHMPRLTGPEALKIIKRIKPGITVIIFSSSCDPQFVFETEAKNAGAFDCLYKPFNIDDLLDVINRVVKQILQK